MFLLFLSVLCSLSLDVKACGNNFTDPTGILESPGFPSNYSNNLDCMYVIKRPAGERITLTFERFDLEWDAGCRYDYVEIRAGDSMTSPWISHDCGTTLPSPKRSFENTMLILFRSDTSNTGIGFRASYTSACGNNFTDPTGILESPGFPSNYSNYLNCMYVIKRPAGERITLTFEQFDLEWEAGCRYDYVEIRDGDSMTSPRISRDCGTILPSPKRSFENTMLIRFRSGFFQTAKGFRASYTSGVLKDEFFLITSSNGTIFRRDVNTSSNISIPGLGLSNPMAADYDPVDGRVYWTDLWLKHIGSAYLNGTDSKVIRTVNGAAVLGGLAVDPLSRLVFYSDAGNDVIAVMSMSGASHRTVINTDLDQPRAIVLDTMNGIMFWTDWGRSPKIERASYDGTNRRTLHNSRLIVEPNALALDLANNRLYWADAGTEFVEFSDLEGNGHRRISYFPGQHFSGLAYYENNLYVSNWTSAGSSSNVSFVIKLRTGGVTGEAIGSSQSSLNDIHIYSEDNWPKVPNGCGSNNGGCSHFCIPSPNNTFKCMCPDAPTNCIEGAQSVTSRDIPEVAVGVGVGVGAGAVVIIIVVVIIVIPRVRRNKRYQTPTPKTNEPEENPHCSLGQQSVFQGHANPAADRNLEMETCGRESNIYDYIDHSTPFAGGMSIMAVNGDSDYLHPVRPEAYPYPLYEAAHSDYDMTVV